MDLLLIRHGVTQHNAERIFMGHDPVPLSPEGRRQVERLAERLDHEGVTRIVSSDVLRALQSAEIVAGRLGIAVETDRALREVDVGEARGFSYTGAAERWPGLLSPDGEARFPGGESFADVADRAAAYLRRFVIREGTGRVLVVSHGGVVRGVAARLLGKLLSEIGTFAVDNASLSVIRMDGESGTLLAWNDTSHLR
jgi:broad specificity phosphatase PhoE